MGFDFYTRPQRDIVLPETTTRHISILLVKSSSSMYKSHDISTLISPVLTVTEDTPKLEVICISKC